jgi:DNA-binding LytR/AlgR family response regulator
LALDHLNEVKPTLSYTVAGEEVSVPLDDILYIESQLHFVVVHTLSDPLRSGNHTFYAGISSLENQLSQHGFLRIHKSYLVNMKHIRKFQCKFVLLTDNTQLRVSEKNYSEQKKAYLLWKGNR